MKTKPKFSSGDILHCRIDIGAIRRGDRVVVLSVGRGAYNVPFYRVAPLGAAHNDASAFVAEANLTTQVELL